MFLCNKNVYALHITQKVVITVDLLCFIWFNYHDGDTNELDV